MIPFCELVWERPDPKYGCPRTPPHKLLSAYCGSWVIKTEDKWLEWAVLQEEYGWEMLLKAAKACDPKERWRADVEKMCRIIKKRKEDEVKDAAHAKVVAERMAVHEATKEERAAKAKMFADIFNKL